MATKALLLSHIRALVDSVLTILFGYFALVVAIMTAARDFASWVCGKRTPPLVRRTSTDDLPKSVVVSGATSAMGKEMAMWYASHGAESIGLLDKDSDGGELTRVSDELRSKFPNLTVSSGAMDIGDKAAVRSWVRRYDDAHPIDVVVTSASVSAQAAAASLGIDYLPIPTDGTKDAADRKGDADDDIDTALVTENIYATLRVAHAAVGRMKDRGHGTVVFFGSVDGLSAAKGPRAATSFAMESMARTWRVLFAQRGISVHFVVPPSDGRISYDTAESIADGIANGDAVIRVPYLSCTAAYVLRCIPLEVFHALRDGRRWF